SKAQRLRSIAIPTPPPSDHGPSRRDHPPDPWPADAAELRSDQARRPVEPALIAAIRKRKVGQRARRARPACDDRVGSSRDDLERLASNGRIGTGIAFVGDDLDWRPTDILHQGVID